MSRYLELCVQINHWQYYLDLHTRIYSKKQMSFAWFGRMVYISQKIEQMKQERSKYETN